MKRCFQIVSLMAAVLAAAWTWHRSMRGGTGPDSPEIALLDSDPGHGCQFLRLRFTNTWSRAIRLQRVEWRGLGQAGWTTLSDAAVEILPETLPGTARQTISPQVNPGDARSFVVTLPAARCTGRIRLTCLHELRGLRRLAMQLWELGRTRDRSKVPNRIWNPGRPLVSPELPASRLGAVRHFNPGGAGLE